MEVAQPYYGKIIVMDQGPFVGIRLFNHCGRKLREWSVLKRTRVNDHIDGLPTSVDDVANNWRSSCVELEVQR